MEQRDGNIRRHIKCDVRKKLKELGEQREQEREREPPIILIRVKKSSNI